MAFVLSFCAADSGAAGSAFLAFEAAAAAAVPYGFAICAGVLAGVLSLVDMVRKRVRWQRRWHRGKVGAEMGDEGW